MKRLALGLCLVGLLALVGCRLGAQGPAATELWREFSGEKALALVKMQVDLGPRPSGSEALERTRALLEAELKRWGWQVERQSFTENTGRGAITFTNLIARFGSARPADPRVILASHYDTKWFRELRFVGANDGGSSTGALLEIARVLAARPALARRCELAFFDGEEGAVAIALPGDGLQGSRHYARALREGGRAKQFAFGILLDMIGDRNLGVTFPSDSPSLLSRAFFDSSEALGVRNRFTFLGGSLIDDHVPLNQAGIPTIDVIDFDFAPWHTAGDTMESISAASLETVGRVTLHVIGRKAAEIE